MLEKIYEVFTSQMLPKINEGLVISKEYFLELFGRYVNYLIIMDIIWISVCVIGLIVTFVIFSVLFKHSKNCDANGDLFIFSIGVLIFSVIIFTIPLLANISHLVKDIYIPEIRILEQLKYTIK